MGRQHLGEQHRREGAVDPGSEVDELVQIEALGQGMNVDEVPGFRPVEQGEELAGGELLWRVCRPNGGDGRLPERRRIDGGSTGFVARLLD
ncbi:MAG TPA: hypothetical protein VJM33_14805 [Microthrixaceae bacterium]|nr:hypothetical protein [Microthrixaceae bacterium]